MKKGIVITFLCCWMGLSATWAELIFNDRLTYTIGNPLPGIGDILIPPDDYDDIFLDMDVDNQPGTLLNMNAGIYFGHDIEAYNHSRIRMYGSSGSPEIYLNGNSDFVAFDGNIEELYCRGDSTTEIHYAIIDRISLRDNASVLFHAGSIDDDISIINSASLMVFAGRIGEDIDVRNDATVDIFGGLFDDEDGDLSVFDNGRLNLHGSDFALNSISVDWGEFDLDTLVGLGALNLIHHPSNGYDRYTGRLTGLLDNGTPVDVLLHINRAYDTPLVSTANISLIPEPATLLMVSLGGFIIRRRTRR